MQTIDKLKMDSPGRYTAYIAGQESFIRGQSLIAGWTELNVDKSRYDQFVLGYTNEKTDWETRPGSI